MHRTSVWVASLPKGLQRNSTNGSVSAVGRKAAQRCSPGSRTDNLQMRVLLSCHPSLPHVPLHECFESHPAQLQSHICSAFRPKGLWRAPTHRCQPVPVGCKRKGEPCFKVCSPPCIPCPDGAGRRARMVPPRATAPVLCLQFHCGSPSS